jgi:3-isopropylmalate dehydrogenase
MVTSGRVHRIAVVPGDGVGPEVVAAALHVLDAVEAAEGFATVRTEYDLGAHRYLRDGETLSAQTLGRLQQADAILLGAIGSPEVAPGILERQLLLELRRRFDLYINLRPVRLHEGVSSPIAGLRPEHCDVLIVRENTESLYTGAGGVAHQGRETEIATQESLNTYHAVRRAVRFAFDLANGRPRRHLTLVHKTNVLSYAGALWSRVVDEITPEYPEVTTGYAHVDAACLHMVAEPQRFDVIVTDNLFGDIISDVGAAVQGGIGLAASGNLNPERRHPSMFEPIHGSAPDIAGTGIADPTAAVISLAMMLDFLGEQAASRRVKQAVDAHLRSARGTAATAEIGWRIAEHAS